VSVPAVDHDDEFIVDPDDLKMPESPEHRRVTDLIAAVAERLLPDTAIYRDMNWYPLDGRTAIAPDVMTLPIGIVQRGMKSYRQPSNGVSPGVAVEIASASDSVSAFTAKTHRYRRLGVPLYVVTVDIDALDVVVHRDGPERWIGRPIPELGGLRIDVNDDSIVVVMPDGLVLHTAGDLVRHADRRVEELEAQLRSLGIEPSPNA
jgi:Uma2 family endonuclease